MSIIGLSKVKAPSFFYKALWLVTLPTHSNSTVLLLPPGTVGDNTAGSDANI